MKIDSLKKFDATTAARILSSLALSTTNPGVGDAAEAEKAFIEERKDVLLELRGRPSKALSEDRNIDFAALLTAEMKELALAGKDEDAILARAGHAGRLSLDLYSIKYTKAFPTLRHALGITEVHVEGAIRKPSEVQHFHAELPFGGSYSPFSLFLKFHVGKREHDAFWLVVVALRKGRILLVHFATRVYTSDVDLSDAIQPIDVLRAFAEKYGLTVNTGGRSGRFVTSEEYARPSIGRSVRTITIKQTRGLYYHALAYTFDLHDRHRLLMAFAINLTKYQAAMRIHGVRVKLDGEPESQEEVRYTTQSFRLAGGDTVTHTSTNSSRGWVIDEV